MSGQGKQVSRLDRVCRLQRETIAHLHEKMASYQSSNKNSKDQIRRLKAELSAIRIPTDDQRREALVKHEWVSMNADETLAFTVGWQAAVNAMKGNTNEQTS